MLFAEDSSEAPEPLLLHSPELLPLSPLVHHSPPSPVIFQFKTVAEPSQTDSHTDHKAELELVATEPPTVLLLWNVAAVDSLLLSPPVPKQLELDEEVVILTYIY